MQAVTAALLLFGLMLGAVWPVVAQPTAQPGHVGDRAGEFRPGELLVKFRAGVSASSVQNAPRRYDADYVETLYGGDIQLWRVPDGEELRVSEQLNADPQIEHAEPNYRVYAMDTVPNDPSYGKQWAHNVMRSPSAWDLATGAATITIAILDTGIDGGHPDLRARLVGGYDAVDGDSNPVDLNGHGTHVAGIAAAVTNNGVGVAGMDWQARIMPIRVLEEDGGGYVEDLVEGINWARLHGAEVLNLSLGTYADSTFLRDAVAQAHAAGRLVVAAMGNENTSARVYPAAYDQVLAVAATGPADTRAPYSNFGSHCDVAAPGGAMTYLHDPAGIYSTMPTYAVWMTTNEGYFNSYDYVHGTSEAVPYVAGLAGLIWAMDPALTAGQVQNTIKSTAKDLGAPGWDPYYGRGRIDPLAALRAHSPPVAPILGPIDNADGNGAYLLDWNDVPYATSYTVEEARNPSFTPATRYEGLLMSQYQATGRGGGAWYYRVRGRNSYGDGAWSNRGMTVVRPEPPVLSLVPDPGNADEYRLDWEAAAGGTGYRLEEAGSESFTNPTIRYRGSMLHYNVTGQPGGTWHYRVLAYNSAGDSGPSNPVSVTVPPPVLPAPMLEPIDNQDGDGQYWVSWQAVTGTLAYTLEESADPYFSAPTVIYSGPDLLALVSGQSRGRWTYRVRALGPGEARSPWSEARSAVVPFYTYLPLVVRNYFRGELANGDFEDGPMGWTEYSSSGLPLILNSASLGPVPPHSGTWAARLGRSHDPLSSIEQRVKVPVDRPLLRYWHWVDSADECGFDVASVRVDGALVRVYDLCKSKNTGGWVEVAVNLSSYGGQTVTLQIRVEADSSLESSLYVDDVSFGSVAAANDVGWLQASGVGNRRLDAVSRVGVGVRP